MTALTKRAPSVKARLESLYWVQSAQKVVAPYAYDDNYKVWRLTTRPGALKVEVTRYAKVGASGTVQNGKKLPKPVSVALPQYHIFLHSYLDSCRVQFVEPPELPPGIEWTLVFPTGEMTSAPRLDLMVYANVCGGSYSMTYDYQDDLVFKAQCLAELIQFGKSHHAAWRSNARLAYRLGILPESCVKRAKKVLADGDDEGHGDAAGADYWDDENDDDDDSDYED